MPTRGTFLRHTFVGTLGLLSASAVVRVYGEPAQGMPEGFKGNAVFDRILTAAPNGWWGSLPIGQVIANVAHLLDATPQAGFSLEISPSRGNKIARPLGPWG